MMREEFERDVADVATGLHPTVFHLRERDTRDSLVSEATITCVYVECQPYVGRSCTRTLPRAASTLRIKSTMARLQSWGTRHDPIGVFTHDRSTSTRLVWVAAKWMPHRLTSIDPWQHLIGLGLKMFVAPPSQHRRVARITRLLLNGAMDGSDWIRSAHIR